MSLFLLGYSGIIQVLLPGTGTRACWYLVVLQIFQFELIFILNLDHHFTINLELDTTRVSVHHAWSMVSGYVYYRVDLCYLAGASLGTVVLVHTSRYTRNRYMHGYMDDFLRHSACFAVSRCTCVLLEFKPSFYY